MEYIRLSVLKNLSPEFSFPLSEANQEAFRQVLYASNIGMQQGVYENEQLINSLISPREVLFREWTEQNAGLCSLLEGKVPENGFRDSAGITTHALAGHYRAFISPFLRAKLEQLLQKPDRNQQTIGLSYCALLTDDDTETVQEVVYRQLAEERAVLEDKLRRVKNEAELLELINPYLKASFVNLLNSFSVSHYRVRTTWMELLIGVVHHPGNTRRLSLHVIQNLQRLDLNNEHLKELKELERDINSGALKVEDLAFPWKRVLIWGSGVIAAAAAVYLIFMMPKEFAGNKDQEKTAYMSFTEEERERLDSLLQQAKVQHKPGGTVSDENMTPVGIEVTQKKEWKNERLRALVNTWEAKDTTNRQPDPHQSMTETRVFPTTQDLRKRKSELRVQFQNRTEISVLVIVFDNEAGKPVYSTYLRKQGWTDFEVKPGEYLLCLPGSKVPDELKKDKLPFDQVNSDFFMHLDTYYSFKASAPETFKLVWTEASTEFYLLDIHNALEKP